MVTTMAPSFVEFPLLGSGEATRLSISQARATRTGLCGLVMVGRVMYILSEKNEREHDQDGVGVTGVDPFLIPLANPFLRPI